MDQSRMIRWARKGAEYGFVAAAGLAALGVMLGPRSMVLPIALVGGIAGVIIDRSRGRYRAVDTERVAALESVVDALGSDVAQLQAHHEFDRELVKPRIGPPVNRAR